ncbi:MAG: exo-beta-N-acetylmuramidase NamZ domain-containing protein [bacterium]
MKKKLFQGTDNFIFDSLKGRKTALIVNHTSIDKKGTSTVEKMISAGVQVVAIFSLEHGYFPVAQDMESVGKENKIKGIPVFSLYGDSAASLKPDPSFFDLFDVAVYDIQDIGSRYYTYLASLAMFMDELQSHPKELIILDRINPIGGTVEGALLDENLYKSFVGYFPLFHRHGLTSAEVALYYYKLRNYDFPLKIEYVTGWERFSFLDEYDYPWLPTSPNMPTLEAAILYPGGCLIEGTELSEGRGTTFPFQVVGAQGIDPFKLKKELDSKNISGITFIPLEFRPAFQKEAMKKCGGVYISLTDRFKVKPLRAYISIVQTFRKIVEGDFFRSKPYEFIKDIPAIELLLGDKNLIEMFYNFADMKDIDEYLKKGEKEQGIIFEQFKIY